MSIEGSNGDENNVIQLQIPEKKQENPITVDEGEDNLLHIPTRLARGERITSAYAENKAFYTQNKEIIHKQYNGNFILVSEGEIKASGTDLDQLEDLAAEKFEHYVIIAINIAWERPPAFIKSLSFNIHKDMEQTLHPAEEKSSIAA